MALQALAVTQEETGVAPEIVELHLPLAGGSFGRRVGCDDVRMVIAVAKRFPGTPTQDLAIGNFGMESRPRVGTAIAAAATVEVTEAAALVIQALDLAFDCGQILNEDAVPAQLEGSMIFGLNVCLSEELTVKDGQSVQNNFDRYAMQRIADVPRQIGVHMGALTGDSRYGGTGEGGCRRSRSGRRQRYLSRNGQTPAHNALSQCGFAH